MPIMWIVDEFRKSPVIAAMFFVIGFVIGLGAFKYGSGLFNADVVLRGSYIYKSDIESTFVPVQRFAALSEELKSVKLENESFRKEVEHLRAGQSAMSTSVCQRFAMDASSLTTDQHLTESEIQRLLSPYTAYAMKSEPQLGADRLRVQELRKYSQQINDQLLQLRNEISKCKL
jgi:hypothetical protein